MSARGEVKGHRKDGVASSVARNSVIRRVRTADGTRVLIRSPNQEGATKYDFYFSRAPCGTAAKEFARVALAAHRIEEAIKRGKSEAGLSHYEVRNWRGWHHHQVLSFIATWFLVREAQRGKKVDSGDHRAADSRRRRHAPANGLPLRHADPNRQEQNTPSASQRRSAILSLQST